jgi:hypothetical protein
MARYASSAKVSWSNTLGYRSKQYYLRVKLSAEAIADLRYWGALKLD